MAVSKGKDAAAPEGGDEKTPGAAGERAAPAGGEANAIPGERPAPVTRPLPAPNLQSSASSEANLEAEPGSKSDTDAPDRRAGAEQDQSTARPRFDFGLEHRYDPPLLISLERPLIAGDRVAFTVRLPEPPNGDRQDQAFFYRLETGEIVGYFNRCTHITIPLDYDDGEFLDGQGYIMCRVHGARYELATGLRCAGPARTHLTRILLEEDGAALRIFGWQKVR